MIENTRSDSQYIQTLGSTVVFSDGCNVSRIPGEVCVSLTKEFPRSEEVGNSHDLICSALTRTPSSPSHMAGFFSRSP